MRRHLALLFACAALLILRAGPATPADEIKRPVDLHLVLAIDSSSSVSMDEFYLQLEGYAAAFRHPDLLAAIHKGSHRAIAVTLFEWSTASVQRVNFERRQLEDQAGLEAFADELARAPRLVIGGATAIGNAIEFGLSLLDKEAAGSTGRRVIDISGDGVSNSGVSVTTARDRAVQRGITVNGLVILDEEPEAAEFYRRYVIGGGNSFMLTARSYTDFADAILRKLLREITPVAELSPNSRVPL